MFALSGQRGRGGQLFCTITQHRSGLATSYRSQISSFDRSLLSSSSNCASRRVIHVGVTRSPTNPWVAQQLREATPYGQAPKCLICDNDSKFGSCFARVATTSAIEILKTPVHAPRANAICERFLRSVRQECLDHLFIFHEKQLQRVLNVYVAYFNRARPHQGIMQQLPEPHGGPLLPDHGGGKVVSSSVLGRLCED